MLKALALSSFALLLTITVCAGGKQTNRERIFALTHVTIIDVTGGSSRPAMTVVIAGNRIAAITPDRTAKLPANIQKIDATGKFLIPGLWDMHVHLEEKQLFFPLFLANGVIGLRDMGVSKKSFGVLKRLRRQIAQGKILGPRIIEPGPMLDGPRSFPPTDRIVVRTDLEARRAVRWLKQHGADFVKVHSFPSREAYLAIADEAKKQGLTLVGHVPARVSVSEAIAAGHKSIEHNTGVQVACSAREEELQRRILEPLKKGDDWISIVRAEAEATDTYDKQKATALFAQLAKKGTWVCPTLVSRQANTVSETEYLNSIMFKYYPSAVRQKIVEDTKSDSKEEELIAIETAQKSFPATMRLTSEMRRAGVQLLAGTDAPEATPGFSLHDELELLVKAGLTPMESLQTATINPARFLGLSESLGTVEKGKLADLVLLDANPLEDIRNTKRIDAVVVEGRFLNRKALDRLLAQAEARANRK